MAIINKLKKLIIKKIKNTKVVKNQKAKKIGIEGETLVSNCIKSVITNHKGMLLNNVIFQNNKFSTQIDHIIIGNNRNIIVIETKNYKGLIVGNESDNYWYQNLGNKSYSFRNPIIQNNGHIRELSNVLNRNNISNCSIINLVVFTNKCTLSNKNNNVIHINELENTLRQYLVPTQNCSNDIFRIIKQNGFIDNKKASKQHLKYVKQFK